MITVLLPAYNEEKSLAALFAKLQVALEKLNLPYRILVCNDGSDDRTGELLEQYSSEFPIEILQHKINRGLGETSRDLFEHAAEISEPDDIIIRMDCDDTHEPKYIPMLVEKLNQGYDVVSASRFVQGGGQVGINVYRRFISYCANLFMKVLFPISGFREYSCGLRAYKASIIQEAVLLFGNNFIQLKGLGFTCTLEKLVKLKMLGARFSEIPFVLRYDQKKSSSKMVSSITTLGYLTMALLYHWPWGGWKSSLNKGLRKKQTDSF
jgi:dolichol-phosphate mannosyltransferase